MTTTRYVLPLTEGIDPIHLKVEKDLVQQIENSSSIPNLGFLCALLIGCVVFTFVAVEAVSFLRNCNCLWKDKVQTEAAAKVLGEKKLLRFMFFLIMLVFVALTIAVYAYFLG